MTGKFLLTHVKGFQQIIPFLALTTKELTLLTHLLVAGYMLNTI